MKIEKKNVYWAVGALIVSFGIVGATKLYDYYNSKPVAVEQKISNESIVQSTNNNNNNSDGVMVAPVNQEETDSLNMTPDMENAIQNISTRMFVCDVLGYIPEADSKRLEEVLLRVNFTYVNEQGQSSKWHVTKEYLSQKKVEIMNKTNDPQSIDMMARTQELNSICLTTRNTSNLLIKTIKQYNGE